MRTTVETTYIVLKTIDILNKQGKRTSERNIYLTGEITPTTVGPCVKGLLSLGLIQREKVLNYYKITLTETGKELYSHLIETNTLLCNDLDKKIERRRVKRW